MCILKTTLSFISCYFQESRCLLGTYVFCVIVLIGAMIGGIALAASGTELLDLKTPLKETMADYDTSNTADPVTKAWDDIQKEYDCCGVDGPQDWAEFGPSFGGANVVPASCCDHLEESAQSGCRSDPRAVTGCYVKFEEIITQNESLIFSIVSITLIALVSESTLADCCGVSRNLTTHIMFVINSFNAEKGISHFPNAMFDARIPLFQVANAALAIMMWCAIR